MVDSSGAGERSLTDRSTTFQFAIQGRSRTTVALFRIEAPSRRLVAAQLENARRSLAVIFFAEAAENSPERRR